MKNNQIWEILYKEKREKKKEGRKDFSSSERSESRSKFSTSSNNKDEKIQNLLKILLQNRGLKTKKEQEAFLHPDITTVTPLSVGIDAKGLTKALKRIEKAIQDKERIIVFGDYDVDGIAGTAILWETLHSLGAQVTPYIPNRVEEGYGLSIRGIQNVVLNVNEGSSSKDSSTLAQNDKVGLIITVDNGIVANEAVDFANTLGIDVIISDHHVPSSSLPKAFAFVHTTKLCGTGVAYMLAKEISKSIVLNVNEGSQEPGSRIKSGMTGGWNDHLALVALATVADLVPLTQANRVLLAEGLQVLHITKRPGIVALCEEAGIKQSEIGVYEIGHMIGPRLNAMGRIASAMDSLRLLCTKDRMRAKVLAEKLGKTNKERQDVTLFLAEKAISNFQFPISKNLLFVADTIYEEGVIGLVAGRLVEVYYRPSIVISIGEKISKASARSVKGFNIIEFIRSAKHLLINAGGHPMAAGFTIHTEKIKELEKFLQEKVEEFVTDGMFERKLKIDCVLPLEFVTAQLFEKLQQLGPFGMANPEPTFVSKAKIISTKQVGKEKKHLSMLGGSVIASKVKQSHINKKIAASSSTPRNDNVFFSAIAFGMGEMFDTLKSGQLVDIVYTIDENVWNDKKSLQLKIKDLHSSS